MECAGNAALATSRRPAGWSNGRLWGALGLIATLGWAYLALDDGAADLCLSGVERIGRGLSIPVGRAWSAFEFVPVFTMWFAMVVAMMVPVAAPTVAAFADVAAMDSGKPAAALRVSAFVAGYLLSWSLFCLLATVAQWGIHMSARLDPLISASSSMLGGVLLISAGLYQWSPMKDRCLTQCRSTIAFLVARWREGTGGALAMGVIHGVHCIGCCWALMALMLFAGAMNLLWIAALTLLMLAEKALPGGASLARAAGGVLAAWGIVLIASG
jgi:predicted metal-binding membrane protein